jgi:hypothetical protein
MVFLLGLMGCQHQGTLKPVAAETVTATYSRVLYGMPSPTPVRKVTPKPTSSPAEKASSKPSPTPKPAATPVTQTKHFIESTETTTVISTQPVAAPDSDMKPAH